MQVIKTAQLDALRGLEASSLPTEFRLFALGDNKTSKGTFKLDQAGLDSVMAAYADHGVELSFDYEHQAFATVSNGQPAPAAGWFKPEARADGLWATSVRWTDKATKMLSEKEYRYFSPAFGVDKKNRITRLLNVALTNLPASKELQALVAAKADVSPPHSEIKTMNIASIIGLKEDAPEGDVEARVVAAVQTEKDLLSITGKSTVAEAMALVVFAKDASTKLAAAEKENAEWAARFAADQAQSEEVIERAMFADAIACGQVGRDNDELIGKLKTIRASQGLEGLKLAIDLLPKRAVRLHQAPPPVASPAAQDAAIKEYQAAHPGVPYGEAFVKLAAERPALFPDYAAGGR